MPRVLVVTHDWLPGYDPEIKRVANLCRYLPTTSWSPHILTRDASHAAAMTLTDEEVEQSPTLKHAATVPVSRAAEDLADAGVAAVRQFGIGAVLSVCPPAADHDAGGEVARRAGIPWVALFDELDDFYIGPADLRSRLERRRAGAHARRCLRDVWRVGAGTTRALDYLRTEFGVEGDVVMPAFDPDDRRVAPHRDPAAPLRVVHAGAIDRITQAPVVLFEALDAMIERDPSARDAVRLDVIGSGIDDLLAQRLAGRACAAMVTLVPRMEPREVVRVQREADVLVSLYRDEPVARALGGATRAATELVELLPAARPIVLVGGDDDTLAMQMIRGTNTGRWAGDALELSSVLSDHLAELRRAGVVAFDGDESAIARLSATEQVKRVATLLDAASAERFGSWKRARR